MASLRRSRNIKKELARKALESFRKALSFKDLKLKKEKETDNNALNVPSV